MYYTNEPRTDGFGAQFQTLICAIIYSELMNYTFVYTNIKNIDHNYNHENDFTQKLEDFMNIRKNFKNSLDIVETPQIIDVSTSYSYVESKLDLIEELDSYKYIKKIFFEDKVNPYKLETLNVAIHIRRPNPCDNRLDGADTPNSYFLNCIEYIKNKYSDRNIKYYIYSQGSIDNFNEFMNDNTTIYLNKSIEDTFLGLVFADVLIISRSSFSYAAALLTDAKVLYHGIFHKPKSDWIIMN